MKLNDIMPLVEAKLKIIKPSKDTPKNVVDIFNKFNKMDDDKETMSMTNDMSKILKTLKGLGYWISHFQGKTQLNKIGYDQKGKKIDQKAIGRQY